MSTHHSLPATFCDALPSSFDTRRERGVLSGGAATFDFKDSTERIRRFLTKKRGIVYHYTNSIEYVL